MYGYPLGVTSRDVLFECMLRRAPAELTIGCFCRLCGILATLAGPNHMEAHFKALPAAKMDAVEVAIGMHQYRQAMLSSDEYVAIVNGVLLDDDFAAMMRDPGVRG